MRHDHLKRELDLLLLLSQNRRYTADEICDKINISRRSLYYYLEFFRSAGFIVEKYGQYHYISRESPFFHRLLELIQFSDEEAIMLRQLLDNYPQKTILMKSVQQKLEKFFDFRILADESQVQNVTRNLRRLHDAVKRKKMVKLVNYSSNNSKSVSDRIVEPFLFLNNNNDIRCHELKSGINKTFRVSRMESVEILEDFDWIHEDKHRMVYFDLFMFSGEERYPIDLIFGQVARNLLLEEIPDSAPCFAQRPDGRWDFRTEVCSYRGIGRFVLGVLSDIEVKGDAGFKEYLRKMMQDYIKKLEL